MDNLQSEKSNGNVTRFNIAVEQIPYHVEVSSFKFNNETRYDVTINNGPRDIFVWDKEMKMYRGLDDKSAILPDGLMIELNRKLLDLEK